VSLGIAVDDKPFVKNVQDLLLYCEAEDIVEYNSSKHKELSEQLTSWWRTQTDFKTKKSLADFLKVHPDTLGDYFSGGKFPRLDIANRLCELTKIECLKTNAGADSFSGMVPREVSPVPPPPPPPPGAAASIEKPTELDITGVAGPSEERYRLGKTPQVMARQIPSEFPKKGARYEERSVVISLQRTSCPFCAHDIAKFASCLYCGQHFVRASLPIEKNELS